MTVTDHSAAQLDRAHSHGAGVPDSSRADRPQSFDVDTFPVPTGREENWRFSAIKDLAPLFDNAPGTGTLDVSTSALPAGVSWEALASDEARQRSVGAPSDRTASVAAQQAGTAHALVIADGTEVSEPITVSMRGRGERTHGHLLIEAGARCEATVVIERSGTATYGEFVSIDVADGARVNIVFVQQWDADAVHAADVKVRIGADAQVRSSVVTLGGRVVRLNTTAAFAGENASVDLFGVYFADSGQHQEHQLFVDHAVPSCRSRVTYKGALAGSTARTVWIGDVLIRAAAEGTDTYELNRNLVLTPGARADSVPNLEIETGLIEGAGHASATGRFDDEQMFYLRSRGITEDVARKLVVRGFFADLIQEIGVPVVEEGLLRAIDLELEHVDD